jgi:hypothetical protein
MVSECTVLAVSAPASDAAHTPAAPSFHRALRIARKLVRIRR